MHSNPVLDPSTDSENDLHSLQSVVVMVPSLTVNPFHSAEGMPPPLPDQTPALASAMVEVVGCTREVLL